MPHTHPCAGPRPPDTPVEDLLDRSNEPLEPTAVDQARMTAAHRALTGLDGSRRVYGVTHGFGPLVDHPADPDPARQGLGLISHLATGQGEPLPPDVTRTMVWLRLRGMALGHSAVDPRTWQRLADLLNAGFLPVVPGEGSLSASGDLVPLAHAALAFAATGPDDDGEACDATSLAWSRDASGEWRRADASAVLDGLGLPPVTWDARSALAFVNGSSACLARALHTHRELGALTRAAAAVTGRTAALLGASCEPYEEALQRVRNQPGQRTVASWIRAERTASGAPPVPAPGPDRPLQERYSLRCAPQVLGAVLDQLDLQGSVLADEAEGCSDNPVLVDGDLLHGGNFHAAPVAFASETHASCTHQVAYLMERQLALVLDPAANGGLPPLLTPRPGAGSGFAGVQIAASSHLGRLRQLGLPASLTAVPTNLHNQDQVPLALNSANAVVQMTERAWWILGSLLLAVNQLAHLTRHRDGGEARLWRELREEFPPLDRDRPLAGEITRAAALARARHLPLPTTGPEATTAAV
ncbi:aromatic amino acid ammonia-lyase [Streptomyces sp. NEAU-H22]|uniref:aromatic amino acid ammonia-lyase n=1 Tax=unclassified Streptomyces TaxID=2593676 RepID=UPI00224EC58A|nr:MULTISPECIES: aromatic amino acid ammonia-lyase [unclassified Streptomyces]MCX3288108.1 aromatic amino acid ammonia-lyase [Streptomyces sp. NEAU-H22]WMD07380.1 aromatic amino acid ammonia-lyase [Streptomyces sp. FXY-T5]